MAFINKIDPVVLNVKVTSKGRETLSRGHLHFKYFALGDSEIDYEFLRNSQNLPESAGSTAPQFDIFSNKQLRPTDKNPDILSFISRNFITADELFNEGQFNELTSVPSISWDVENSVESIGFFTKNNNNFVFKTTPDFVKQPDMKVDLTYVTGGTELRLFQSEETWGAIRDEPSVGDYLMVRWIGSGDTTSYKIDSEQPAPILFYRIDDIISGTLENDNLVVRVDRNLPDFQGTVVGEAGAMVFRSDVNLFVEQQFSTDYASEALLTFLQNCQCDTIIFPFWKLSIIYTENIVGVDVDDKQFHQYKTNKYAGFVNYIQNQEATIKKLGVIHYSNVSPANVYAEQFLRDTPRLYLPTIMWHKSQSGKLGLTLQASGAAKIITGVETSLNTTYYDLTDLDGNVVGKVFNELKLFVIEDQELLFAMSYKSNRSWTLPNFTVGANDSITDCPICTGNIQVQYSKQDTTAIGGTNGSITITSITGLLNPIAEGKVFVKVVRTNNNQIYFASTITSIGTPLPVGLPQGNYTMTITDLGAEFTPDCEEIITDIIIIDPQLVQTPVPPGDEPAAR